MKLKFFSFLFLVIICFGAKAQFQFVPQIGMNITKTTGEPKFNINTSGAYGFSLGADLRMGKRIYAQPGVFFTTGRTIYEVTDTLYTNEQNIIDRYAIGLRLWLGVKLVNLENFKIRIAVGPSYDFFLGTNDHNNVHFSEDYFKTGTFNLDAGAGFDFWRITVDLSYSFGLTKTFDSEFFSQKPKYQRLYLTMGFMLGKRLPK